MYANLRQVFIKRIKSKCRNKRLQVSLKPYLRPLPPVLSRRLQSENIRLPYPTLGADWRKVVLCESHSITNLFFGFLEELPKVNKLVPIMMNIAQVVEVNISYSTLLRFCLTRIIKTKLKPHLEENNFY